MRQGFGAEFDLDTTYLDTAAVGLPPRHVAEAVRNTSEAWLSGALYPSDLDEPIEIARSAFADLAGVDAGSVTLGTSTSQLLGTIAAALPKGTRVIATEGDFTSVSYPFAAHVPRGVIVDEMPLEEIPSAAKSADVVVSSVVQSADGRILDLDALRENTRNTETKVLLDATQSLGWLDGFLGWADAVVASGYKWLLSPRGCAWMSLSNSLARELTPLGASWFAGKNRGDALYGLPMELAENARRFDSSPAWIPNAGAAVALPWLAGLDRAQVRAHCTGLADELRTELGYEPRGSAIVSFDLGDKATKLSDAGIRTSTRNGRTRFAFYLHNDSGDVHRVLDALA